MDDLYVCPELPETEFDGHGWNALLCAYQETRSPAASGPLLEALKRPARHFCAGFEPLPPVVGWEDIWQQFQVSLLQGALRLRPQRAPHWTAIRLLQRAHRSTYQWIRKQTRVKTEPLGRNLPSSSNVESEAIAALEAWEQEPLYRKLVLGESYELQARHLGVSAASLRQRASRRARELRAERLRGER